MMKCAIVGLASVLGVTGPAHAEWTPTVNARVSEGYDSNVFLQDRGDLATRESLVTAIEPTLGLKWASGGADQSWKTNIAAVYAPRAVWFHSESSEDHVSHLGSLNLSASEGLFKIEFANSLQYTDGDNEGLVFTEPGGAPAAGGPAIRDRRDSTLYRSAFKFSYTPGNWLVRPSASACVQDFQTKHLSTPGYLNYVDRTDVNGGLDVGYRALEDMYVLVGYRYGHQSQSKLLDNPLRYSNDYHRVVAGVEGNPTKWLSIAAAAGPEFRTFDAVTAESFDRDQTYLYVEATATVKFSDADELSLLARVFNQPSFGGRGYYQDKLYTAVWKHRFTPTVTSELGARMYGCEMQKPATRDDWIYTAHVSVAYQATDALRAEVGYLHEFGQSELPDMDGREYGRHFVFAAIKYSF